MKHATNRYESLGSQLRYPHGSRGREVAQSMNHGNRNMNLETISQLSLGDDDHVLEIGMGNGYFVRDIVAVSSGIKYYGCDYSLSMVNESIIANDKWIRNNQARFIVGDAANLPFAEEMFDTVFTVNTIYFWPNEKKVCSEIKRVLKNNGTFVLAFRAAEIMETLPVTPFGFSVFSVDDAILMLRENGFEVVSHEDFADDDLKFDGVVFKNAFTIIIAKKAGRDNLLF